jgi:hypothetical protein
LLLLLLLLLLLSLSAHITDENEGL